MLKGGVRSHGSTRLHCTLNPKPLLSSEANSEREGSLRYCVAAAGYVEF